MPKKVLPKTPDSIFDPVEYETSSRGSTPTPQRSRSRSPTPKFSPLRSPKRNQITPWYERFLISNITFYTFLILTFLLILTVSRTLVGVNYCDDVENFEPDCIKCPSNAICNGTKYHCVEGSYLYKDLCIKYNSPNERSIEIVPRIEELIGNKTVFSIKDILRQKEFDGFTEEQIKIAIHLSDKYVVNNDGESIDVRWNRDRVNFILYFSLGFSLLIFLLSVFFRSNN